VEHRIEEPKPPAPPPPEPPRASVITQPDWARRPDAEALSRYYPERASRMQLEGTATISCSVTARGELANCSIVSENPPEAGFGEATLKASKLFKMRPQQKDGAPTEGGTVRIPLRWVLPKG
jgi:protein TonB